MCVSVRLSDVGALLQGRRSHRIIGGREGIKVDWGSGGRKSPSGVQRRSPGRGSAQKLKLFCESTHNICIKVLQTTVAVTLVDILNDITSKILGGHVPPVP